MDSDGILEGESEDTAEQPCCVDRSSVQLRRCSGFAGAARDVTLLESSAVVRLPVEGSRA